MLYFSFREWKGVLLPFMVVLLSILFSFGFMAFMGWEISIISILLPIMLIAIANDYGIHLINLYQGKCFGENQSDIKTIVVEIYRELKKTLLITALTTIGGMLGLLSHKMPPAAQLGILSSIGIGAAFLLSIFLIPVLLSFYSKPEIQKMNRINKGSLLEKILSVFSGWINNYPKKIIFSFGFVAVLSIAGLFFLEVDTNVESYFTGKSDVKKGIELVNDKFGGSQYVYIVFSGDMLSPELLNRMDKYTEKIKKLSLVGHIISPATFLKELSKGIYSPDEVGYMTLPKSKAEAELYLELFSMTGYDEQVSQLIDYNYENARILVSMKDGSNQTGKAILKSLHEITKDEPRLQFIAGSGLSKIQIADMVISGQIMSLFCCICPF